MILAAIKSGEVRHVVAARLDRLFRNSLDAKQNIEDWNRRQVALHVVQLGGDGPVDTTTTMGRFFFAMLCEVAEMESRMNGDRVRENMAEMKRAMRVYSPPPFGFRVAGRKLTPVPSEQRVVKRILRLHRRNQSFSRIAAVLNAERVPAKKKGATWHGSQVRNVCRNSIHRPRA